MKRNILILFLCLQACGLWAGMTPGVQFEDSFDNGEGQSARFLVFLPEYYTNTEADLPCILFLHGAGERGDDLELVKKNEIPLLLDDRPWFPFIVISPQCPAEQRWDPEVLSALLDAAVGKYRIDEERLYLTGLSMGGYGTWALALKEPERFAAAVPVCGGLRDDDAVGDLAALKDLPIRIYHGGRDMVVPVEKSTVPAAALKKMKANAELTVFPDLGHNSWSMTYNDPKLYLWLLEQSRDGSDTYVLSSGQTNRFRQWVFDYEFGMGACQPYMPIPEKKKKFKICRTNPFTNTIHEKIDWILPAKGFWSLDPWDDERKIKAGKKKKFKFRMAFLGSRRELFPFPTWVSTVDTGHGTAVYTNHLRLDLDAFFAKNAMKYTMKRTPVPPVIDGDIAEPAWEGRELFDRFYLPDASRKADPGTEVRACYDQSFLYLSLVCVQDNEPLAVHGENDANLWEDDSVEIFIDPDPETGGYYHFIINAGALLYDAEVYDRGWNSGCKVKTTRDPGSWTVEIAIPLKDVGFSEGVKGEKIGFQLVRNRHGENGQQSQWSPTLGGNHMPNRFGILEFK